MQPGFKLLIPLIKNSNLKKEHLTKEAGFVDAYTSNLNDETEDAIYLLYEYTTLNKAKSDRFEDLRDQLGDKMKSKYYINGKMYLVYTFDISDLKKHLIQKTGFCNVCTKEHIKKILDFWGTSDEDVIDFMMDKNIKNPEYYEIKEQIIPLKEDVRETIKQKLDLTRMKKGITIEKPLRS